VLLRPITAEAILTGGVKRLIKPVGGNKTPGTSVSPGRARPPGAVDQIPRKGNRITGGVYTPPVTSN
jgi:hypothetical protein